MPRRRPDLLDIGILSSAGPLIYSTHCNDDDGDTGVGPDSATQTYAGAG